MKLIRVLITILPVLFISCEKDQRETSECIIELIESRSYCAKGWDVAEYLFQNKYVYVMAPPLHVIDMTASVYNDNCEVIGYLGGIMGNNIINNELFVGNAIFQKSLCPTDSI